MKQPSFDKAILRNLLEINTAIATVKDREQLLRVIFRNIKPIFPFDEYGLFVLDPSEKYHYELIDAKTADYTPAQVLIEKELGAHTKYQHTGSGVDQVIAEGPKIYSLNFFLGKHPQAKYMKEAGIQELIGGALRHGGKAIGMLCFTSYQQSFYSEKDIPLFKAITNQVAIAVANILANEEILERQKEKEILLSVSEDIATIRQKEDLFSVFTEKLKPVFGFDDVIVTFNVDESHHKILMAKVMRQTMDKDHYKHLLNNVTPNNSIHQQILNSPEPLRYSMHEIEKTKKMADDEKTLEMLKTSGIQSIIGTSLNFVDHCIGSLVFLSRQKESFPKSQFPMIKAVSDLLALAVSNILVNEEIRGKNREQEFKIALTHAITEPGDRQKKYLELAKILQSYLSFDFAVLNCEPGSFSQDHNFRIQRIGSDEYRYLDEEQVRTVLKLELKEFEKLRDELKSPATEIQTGDDYQLFCQKFRFFKRMSEVFELQSYMAYGFELSSKKGAFHFQLFSHQPFAYHCKHLELLRNITPTLQLSLDNMLAREEITSLSEQLEEEKKYLQEEVKTTYNFEEMVGESQEIREVFAKVQEVAELDTSVLLLGETGTGKELIARAIHNNSSRKDRVLVKVNCAAIPSQIVESELFGHEEGAFTGAMRQRIGKFELAHRGTILLDEIGEMPLELQTKLLRVLQEREVERVGSNETIQLDFRVIAATNRNLEEEVQKGKFRTDLFYRLNTFPLYLPPLRARGDDVLLLADYFARQYSQKLGLPFKGFTQKTRERFVRYNWPGNVREMQNLLEQSIIIQKGKVLEIHPGRSNIAVFDGYDADLPKSALDMPTNGHFDMDFIKQQRDVLEKEYILKMLENTKWRVSGKDGAAQRLGVVPSTLESRMRKLGINRK